MSGNELRAGKKWWEKNLGGGEKMAGNGKFF